MKALIEKNVIKFSFGSFTEGQIFENPRELRCGGSASGGVTRKRLLTCFAVVVEVLAVLPAPHHVRLRIADGLTDERHVG